MNWLVVYIEEFEDTKKAIRIHISKKYRQQNGQKKKYERTNNDPQSWKSTNSLIIYFGRNGIHLKDKKMVPLEKGNTT
jgi:hypothetical protein